MHRPKLAHSARYSFLSFICFSILGQTAMAAPTVFVRGDWRVEVLTPTLVRIEKKGPNGWEDRSTLLVKNRDWPGARASYQDRNDGAYIWSDNFTIILRDGAATPITVYDAQHHLAYQGRGVQKSSFFPNPGEPANYALADAPRLIPPAWGATPVPHVGACTVEDPNSGWDLKHQQPDLYVFLEPNLQSLRSEFLKLTGPTELPPLFTFGFWNSRWAEYSEASADAEIREYKKRHIPLDVFILDTDWRIGGSHGYTINEKLFPNIHRFFAQGHAEGLHFMLNDHPEPVAANALDPKELNYRFEGMKSLFDLGADVWWYDRNWGTHIKTPAPALPLEVWGMEVYHDMTQRIAPGRRPLIMTNAYGINNGSFAEPPHALEHRYPIWWTGDTSSTFHSLEAGVTNAVNEGALASVPYLNEDLGGHIGPVVTPELYVRYLEYGCLSPVTRVHCTKPQDRLPWHYGPEAESIVTDYIKLRYRLIPTIYAAARKNFEDGTPLLKRLDLEFPQYTEAKDPSQYLLGENLLVAPIQTSKDGDIKAVPASLFPSGLKAEYFTNVKLEGQPTVTRVDSNIDFDWSERSPDPKIPQENYSVRWTGKLGPVDHSGIYTLQTVSDDGLRLWLDGKKLIEGWGPADSVTHEARVKLEAGRTYDLRVEYEQLGGNALVHLGLRAPSDAPAIAHRSVWIPPGIWENLWTGETTVGPQTIEYQAPLRQTPLYARKGGVILLGPAMEYTAEKPWDPITIEGFPSDGSRSTSVLYEDDGITTNYALGLFAKTNVELSALGNTISLRVSNRDGRFPTLLKKRGWTVRLHVGKKVKAVTVDGHSVTFKVSKPEATKIPFQGKSPDAVLSFSIPVGDANSGHEVKVDLD